jgi:hypothetical protein|tara:strand:+ start:283 stop:603 length:321 start_codon:yes stop_codon:yes gene_type:complete
MFAKTLLLQKHHIRNSCSSMLAFFCSLTSNPLNSTTLHIVIHCDVFLVSRNMPMPSQAGQYKQAHSPITHLAASVVRNVLCPPWLLALLMRDSGLLLDAHVQNRTL